MWTSLLKHEIESAYRAAAGLLGMVDDDTLSWKPPTGSNWMTTGQLLHHLTDACGGTFKGFVTGDWGFPAGVDPSQLPPDEMLPPAEKLPCCSSVAEAKLAPVRLDPSKTVCPRRQRSKRAPSSRQRTNAMAVRSSPEKSAAARA